MCGIYGILDGSGRSLDREVVSRMGRAMRHRGPDDQGFFGDQALMFGMQRLSIIDVGGGHQPIANEDESVVAVCNGEIYNFRELREDLRQRGHTFRSGSDSEVIVHLYEEHGEDCIRHLSGMFALAIWDRRERRLVLARDRLGIKPLYLCRDSSRLIFASELKSILEVPGVRREIDPSSLEEYLALGYVPAPRSMLQGIEKLPPGTTLVADRAGVRMNRYWELPPYAPEERPLREWAADIAAAIEASVAAQMVSDVPLGAFLSGGVDSSAVVGFMARNSSRPVRTYSIGFDTATGGSYYNELPYARRVAELFGTEHHEIVVRPDVTELLPELLWHMDEPIADAAFITTYLVSEFAREDVTVILSGVGGDELFGGYRRYWSERLARQYRRIPAALRQRVVQPLSQRLPSDRHSRLFDWTRLAKGFLAGAELPDDERYEDYMRVFGSGQIKDILRARSSSRSPAMLDAFAAAAAPEGVQRLIEVDLLTQLPDDLLMLTDRMSMAVSLECRVPLLDDRLLELSSRMPSSMKVQGRKLKYAMKEALRDLLPDEIIDRGKRGFGAPIGGWFKNELSEYLDSVLNEETVRQRDVFDWPSIQHLRDEHCNNRQDHTDHLLSLMNFELWSQMYVDGDSCDDISGRIAEAAAR
jgi:asparagine synthase (glutamine-hydrolysing)